MERARGDRARTKSKVSSEEGGACHTGRAHAYPLRHGLAFLQDLRDRRSARARRGSGRREALGSRSRRRRGRLALSRHLVVCACRRMSSSSVEFYRGGVLARARADYRHARVQAIIACGTGHCSCLLSTKTRPPMRTRKPEESTKMKLQPNVSEGSNLGTTAEYAIEAKM